MSKYGISIEVPDENALGTTMAALKRMANVAIIGFDAIGKSSQPRRTKAEKARIVNEFLNSLPKGAKVRWEDIVNLVGKTCATPMLKAMAKEKRIKKLANRQYEKVK